MTPGRGGREDRRGGELPAEWIRELRDHYHPAGDPLREEMWTRIAAEVGAEAVEGAAAPVRPRARTTTPAARRWALPLAVAAGLAIIGGLTLGLLDRPADSPLAPTPPAAALSDPVVRHTLARHLVDTDALLTLVVVDARSGRPDDALGAWARELLTGTRLLLDSVAGDDPGVRPLLEELEVVLAEIALLESPIDAERARSELELVAAGVAETDVQRRIRTLVPAVEDDGWATHSQPADG